MAKKYALAIFCKQCFNETAILSTCRVPACAGDERERGWNDVRTIRTVAGGLRCRLKQARGRGTSLGNSVVSRSYGQGKTVACFIAYQGESGCGIMRRALAIIQPKSGFGSVADGQTPCVAFMQGRLGGSGTNQPVDTVFYRAWAKRHGV